ncbi:MAG TPA: sugar phosphate nucleotidyltransferase, partial [Thermoanaerobaculia bacterium]
MKAMILAAGYGTRLRPVTYTMPKPVVPLAGRPLMGWAVEALLAAGISDFVVNLHHLPEPIERYLRDRYARRARFEFSFEPEILGTGGGVRKVRTLLENDSEFFLVNGDTVQFPPYDALRAARRNALAALTLRHPPEG